MLEVSYAHISTLYNQKGNEMAYQNDKKSLYVLIRWKHSPLNIYYKIPKGQNCNTPVSIKYSNFYRGKSTIHIFHILVRV